jgi:hypothetical protein
VLVIVSLADVTQCQQQLTCLLTILDTTDTDYSESEAFSSLQISGQVKSPPMSPPSRSEGMVMRIETTRVVPSQPEVVLSDGEFKVPFRTNLPGGKKYTDKRHKIFKPFLSAFNVN